MGQGVAPPRGQDQWTGAAGRASGRGGGGGRADAAGAWVGGEGEGQIGQEGGGDGG